MKKTNYLLLMICFSLIAWYSCGSDSNNQNNGEEKPAVEVPKTPAELFTGRWMDSNDTTKTVIFKNGRMITRIEGKSGLQTSIYTFYEKCLEKCQQQSTEVVTDQMCFISAGEKNESICHKIIQLDKTTLQFALMDDPDNVFTMNRIK